MNRFYGALFVEEILPEVYTQVLRQVDNLRSNNSKEALTLASEIFEHQNIEQMDQVMVSSFVSVLFTKTVSEKSFIKKEALSAVDQMANKYNPFLLEEIAKQTLSLNSHISELGAKILVLYIENNKISQLNGQFLSVLIKIINGKRAVVQKKGK